MKKYFVLSIDIIFYIASFILATANFVGMFIFTFPFILIYQIYQFFLLCFGKNKDELIISWYFKSLYKTCFKDLI